MKREPFFEPETWRLIKALLWAIWAGMVLVLGKHMILGG